MAARGSALIRQAIALNISVCIIWRKKRQRAACGWRSASVCYEIMAKIMACISKANAISYQTNEYGTLRSVRILLLRRLCDTITHWFGFHANNAVGDVCLDNRFRGRVEACCRRRALRVSNNVRAARTISLRAMFCGLLLRMLLRAGIALSSAPLHVCSFTSTPAHIVFRICV